MFAWNDENITIKECIENYLPDFDLSDENALLDLVGDVVACKTKYKFKDYSEYFKFCFYSLPNDVRDTFLGADEYSACCKNSISDIPGNASALRNKFETYIMLKDYYGRDVIKVDGFEDYQVFKDFATKNNTFIAKEIEGTLGSNISRFIIRTDDEIKGVFFRLLQYGGCVCETWIEQCDEMAKFNSSSVNTVRVTTMLDDSGFHKIYAMFRTGRNGEVVDNASMGGIAAAVDMETGEIISDGYTKKLERFECHPDTNVKFKGYQIPRWDEVMPMLKEMHTMCPISKLVGWDLALTDDGWVLIEGNGKPNIDTIQLIYGQTFGHGLKDKIMAAMGKYNEE